MGIIRAVAGAVGGALADSWQEAIEPAHVGETTVMSVGEMVRQNDRRGQNRKGTQDVISNGSIIHVPENMFMLLTDGGKVVDYSGEAGYFRVEDGSMPSLFNGEFLGSVRETFNRVRFGGATPYKQRVYYINTQEIKNIPFGTPNPINYFDNFYNAELHLRANGYFSIRIEDPLKFYTEVVARDAEEVDFRDINKLYLAEFLTALQTAMNKMSVDGIRISHVTSRAQELAKYMSDALDGEWNERRGMVIVSVGMNSISYDGESRRLIDMRNQGAMLGDPAIREGYVQGAVARGIESAGANEAGSAAAFMGVGLGMNAAGNVMGAASSANIEQMRMQQGAAAFSPDDKWKCACGQENAGNFCMQCGAKKPQPAPPPPPAGAWTCACGQENTGNFCPNCGKKKPEQLVCPGCGKPAQEGARFCMECGRKLEE